MRPLLTASLLLFSAFAWAQAEFEPFDSEVDRLRYQALTEEMRCPKCQNQNLADSNSPIAQDLRREIHRMVSDGRSDREIVDFMVARYGEFVLYRPRWDANTQWLWLVPGALLFAGGAVVLTLSRRRRTAVAASLSEDDQRRLQQLLQDEDRNP